jgi:integrase
VDQHRFTRTHLAKQMKRGQGRRRRTPVLTMVEADRLVANTDERYRTAVWLLILAGLRPAELCGLRVMDVDWRDHTISVTEVQMWVKGELVVKGPKTATGMRQGGDRPYPAVRPPAQPRIAPDRHRCPSEGDQ